MTGLVGIGVVVAELRDEFPDISASKIRFLEGEGLLDPQRTPRGSRRYSRDDIDRLRRILRWQRDEFLPLRVIRDQIDRPAETSDAGDPPPSTRLRRRRVQSLSRAELCERSGIDRATLTELERYGLVAHHDTEALTVCTAVARLQEFGIEPRHLRAFRVAADREIGLVEQALAPHRGEGTRSAPRASEQQAREQLLALCVDLHTALVRQALSD